MWQRADPYTRSCTVVRPDPRVVTQLADKRARPNVQQTGAGAGTGVLGGHGTSMLPNAITPTTGAADDARVRHTPQATLAPAWARQMLTSMRSADRESLFRLPHVFGTLNAHMTSPPLGRPFLNRHLRRSIPDAASHRVRKSRVPRHGLDPLGMTRAAARCTTLDAHGTSRDDVEPHPPPPPRHGPSDGLCKASKNGTPPRCICSQ